MKCFQVFLVGMIYVFILPPCHTNDARAAINIGVSHATLEGLKENFKISRAKRALEYCEGLISGYRTNKYSSCIPLGDRDPFCNEDKCLDKPSEPETINHTVTYNKRTKRLDLTITWSKPKFGISSLCGFQINVIMLYPSLDTNCFQLNSKNVFTYTLQNMLFNAEYKIRIASLPGYKEQDKSSTSIQIETPDRCKTLKQWNESLPWDCKLTNNFPVVCENGRINITLERPNNVQMDYYYSMVMTYSSQRKLTVNETFHNKGQRFVVYTRLKSNLKYVLKVMYMKDQLKLPVSSQPFTCRDRKHPTSPLVSSTAPNQKDPNRNQKDPNQNQNDKTLLFILLSVTIVILVTIVACIKCKLMDIAKKICTIRPRSHDSEKQVETFLPKDSNLRVLLIYPFGCEHLKKLVLKLGQLLQNMGCQCIFDLVDEEFQNEGHRGLYLIKRLREVQEGDYVIFINYQETNSKSQNALKCHRDAILVKRLDNMLTTKTFISIYFDTEEPIELAININFADVENGLENLVRTVFEIPRYQLGNRLPYENTIEVDPCLKEDIIESTNLLRASVHGDCFKEYCERGQKGGCNKPVKIPVFSENSTPTNSFVSLKLTDNDVVDYQHINFVRLSSSEPLLTSV